LVRIALCVGACRALKTQRDAYALNLQSSLTQTLLVNLLVVMLVMFAMWGIGTVRRDASIVDPFWGTGFVIVTWVAWFINSPVSLRVLILTTLTTVWGLRLSLFLLWRNRGHGEDHSIFDPHSHQLAYKACAVSVEPVN
jgi:steroid 5-alpha reductase family enzyme